MFTNLTHQGNASQRYTGIQFHPKHPIPGSLLPNTIKEDDLAFGEVGLVLLLESGYF